MKKIFFIFFILTGFATAQNYKVENVKGSVKAQLNGDEKWVNLKEGVSLKPGTTLLTGENSLVEILYGNEKFILKESSAIPVGSIKKISLDDLLLALAMEDMINAPKKKNEKKSESTAAYGTEEKGKTEAIVLSEEFGFKRLKGAKQLAESGFKESALINSKEIYRKYPSTKTAASYRIFFADILIEKGLYEEAYKEFSFIKKLELSEPEKQEVNKKLEDLNKKLTAK